MAALYKKWSIVSMLLILPACALFGPTKTELTIKDLVMTQKDLKSLFPETPAQITSLAENALADAKKDLETLYSIPKEERTFENTVRALDAAESNFAKALTPIVAMSMVHPDQAIRDEAHKQEVRLEQESVDLFDQNKQLYEAFKEYAEGNALQDKLKPHERYYIDEAMKGFKRSGLELSDTERKKVTELKKKLSELTTQFDRNIAEDKTTIEVTAEELDGLPKDFINSLKKTDDGKLILGVDYPTYFRVMKNAPNAKVRKRLYKAFQNRAYPINMALLDTIIALRDDLAKALGYTSYAALEIDSQMVKKPELAESFINELVGKAQKKGLIEFQMLTKDLPEGVVLTAEGKMNPWDMSYVIEQYKQKNYDISDEKIAEYFPMESTVNALLTIYEKFFGIHLKISPLPELWDKELKLIEVKKDNQLLGYIILDLFPRPNKYSHACHIGLYPAVTLQDGTKAPSVGIVVANFPKPAGDKPSLLQFSDAVTFFHEFGHALHAVLGRTELAGQSGTSVKRDFVELPSQMLEEWLFDPEIIKMVSSHYKTGEPLPDDIIKKKIELKRLNSGNMVLGQSIYARTSLDYFKEGQKKDTNKIIRALEEKFQPYFAREDDTHFQASFGHLMGYGSKYYGYLWSKVFALDLFDTIKKSGLLNPEIGEKYIKEVIGKGGSQDPNELLRNFLGREPNQEAFLKDLGLEA